jgi:hypothetical protein
MEHKFIKWGGRARRYKEFRGAVRRQQDPVTDTPVSFSTDILFENWLLHRFNPRVSELRLPYKYCLSAPDKTTLRAKVHLDLNWKDGSRELQVVGSDVEVPARLRALGKSLGATVTLRAPALIRHNMTLITNLRHLRRQMQQHGHHSAEVCDAADALILNHLRNGPRRVSELWQLAVPAPNGFIDGRLGHLHVRGVVIIELEGDLYGDSTTARQA